LDGFRRPTALPENLRDRVPIVRRPLRFSGQGLLCLLRSTEGCPFLDCFPTGGLAAFPSLSRVPRFPGAADPCGGRFAGPRIAGHLPSPQTVASINAFPSLGASAPSAASRAPICRACPVLGFRSLGLAALFKGAARRAGRPHYRAAPPAAGTALRAALRWRAIISSRGESPRLAAANASGAASARNSVPRGTAVRFVRARPAFSRGRRDLRCPTAARRSTRSASSAVSAARSSSGTAFSCTTKLLTAQATVQCFRNCAINSQPNSPPPRLRTSPREIRFIATSASSAECAAGGAILRIQRGSTEGSAAMSVLLSE
jgi:hypothetical protein